MMHEPSKEQKVNPMDITASTMVMSDDVEGNLNNTKMIVEDAEASFPSPEEIRTSSTSRSSSCSNKGSIWSGNRNKSAVSLEYTNKNSSSRSYRRICLSLIVIAVLVLFVIIPAMVVSSKNKSVASDDQYDNETNGDNTKRPNYGDIVDFVVGNRISLEMDVAGAGTPQAQAIVWLMRDDPANKKVPTSSTLDSYEGYMYMVRYVMAVNYFALGGVDWEYHLQFLMQTDVCDWNDDVHVEETIFRMGLFCANVPSETEGKLVNVPYSFYIGMSCTFWVLSRHHCNCGVCRHSCRNSHFTFPHDFTLRLTSRIKRIEWIVGINPIREWLTDIVAKVDVNIQLQREW
jgi:hypothetical protein